MFLS
ncbi:hypothetical protein CIB84_016149 [Bambusicola thoracicus]|jgi:hypothetical protein